MVGRRSRQSGRDFAAERPGTKLVGDITYIRTWEGFLYLATVIDCHSKAVLGWAMAELFFSAIKNEWLHRFVFTTRAKARRQVIRYIEGFYNRRRLHSALGYRPPLEVLTESLSTQTAA
jgi:transposase InsO family protein